MTYNSINDLKLANNFTNDFVYVKGYFTAQDGGQGFFIWDDACVKNDNNGTIIRPFSINILSPGRWRRLFESESLNVNWFGIIANGEDQSMKIQDLINFVQTESNYINDSTSIRSSIFFPSGNYVISNTLLIQNRSIKIFGEFAQVNGTPTTKFLWYKNNPNYPTNDNILEIKETNLSANKNVQIIIECIFFDGGANRTDTNFKKFANRGIYGLNIHGLIISKVRVVQSLVGIEMDKCYCSSILQSVIDHNLTDGIILTRQCNAFLISNCIVNSNGIINNPLEFSNIRINGVEQSSKALCINIENCDIEFGGNENSSCSALSIINYGISVQFADIVNIKGCYFEGQKYHFYASNTSNGINLIGNYFQDGTVNFDLTKNAVIMGNQFISLNCNAIYTKLIINIQQPISSNKSNVTFLSNDFQNGASKEGNYF